MPIITCWSAKGGSGTTVTAAAIALAADGPAVLVDLDGELPAVLGLPEPAGQGLAEWFASDAPPGALDDLAVDVQPGVRLVPGGAGRVPRDAPRWTELAAWMGNEQTTFVIDAGVGPPPAPLRAAGDGSDRVDGDAGIGRVRDVLVTYACYLALRRVHALDVRPGGVVLIHRDKDSLGEREIARSVGAPVVAKVPVDPAVWRGVNAGLLAAELPGSLRKAVRRLWTPRAMTGPNVRSR